MAILIPSKNIYQSQNPKIRDNVIERIEVGATEIVPNNEYETPVFNEDIVKETILNTTKHKEGKKYNIGDGYRHYFYARVETRAEYYQLHNIKVPIHQKNSYVNSLYLGKNEETNMPNISFSVSGSYKKGELTGMFELTSLQADGYYTGTNYRTPFLEERKVFNIDKDFRTILENNYSNVDPFLVLEIVEPDETNLSSIINADIINEDGVDYFEIKDLKILGGIRKGKLRGEHYNYSGVISEEDIIYCKGEYEYYKPEKIRITVLGNTIGIDLTDKTVYLPDGNTDSKKLISVEGNELMQTANYYSKDEGVTKVNAIDKAFSNTLFDYSKGKETATIRCDINDYYAYDESKESKKGVIAISANGSNRPSVDLSISKVGITYEEYGSQKDIEIVVKSGQTIGRVRIEEATNAVSATILSHEIEYCAMTFKEYQEVIPMVYGADGKDRPMSLYKDGSPKVFKILGTNIFYDGAVWQELSLQEV